MDLAIGMSVICFLSCGWITYKSYCNMKQGIIDSGAQTVVTIGVLFTFIGIAVGLFNFDTSVEKMGEQLDIFLGGMKTAFWTSIIGMVFGIVIKIMQFGVEKKEDEFIRKNLAAIDLTNTSVKDNTITLLTALNEIKASIEASSNAKLQAELSRLVSAMDVFVSSSAESRSDMKNLSKRINEQSKMLERLSEALTKNIADFGESQNKNLEVLSEKIVESGNNQSQRLDIMNKTIDKMRVATETAQKNSQELLNESKSYQRQALENDEKQLQVLSDNTAQIVGMKKSFDNFLQTMANNFSKEFIAALTKSIETLNTQLQSQFGENFKELNAAVREVVAWQREYKDIVELTTEELNQINKAFKDFTQTVPVAVEKQIATLTKSLKTFGDSTNKNVAVQKNLNEAVIQLSNAVEQSKNAVREMHAAVNQFGQFRDEVLKKNEEALEKHLDTVDKTVEEFGDEMKKLKETALSFTTDTEHYLRDFRTVSGNVMSEIRIAIEDFKKDFNSETKKSVENLDKIFAELAKNTDKQSDKAVKNLAAALGAINNQMVDNYSALIKRLAELDRIINESRRN